MKLSFDGFGINGGDEYKSRLATLTRRGQEEEGLGPLLAAAPDLYAELDILVGILGTVLLFHRAAMTPADSVARFTALIRAEALLEELKK